MTVWHINTKLNTQLEWKSLECKRAYLRRPRVHFGANISMKIGIPLQSYPLQCVKGRNREVDLRPLKFTKMLELILSSGYHGVFSCTRDIRYPYRKKKDLFLELSIKLHTFIMGGFRGGPRGPHLLFFQVKFCFVL